VLIGVLTLVIDLGEPFRAYHLFLKPSASVWRVIPGIGAAGLRGWPFGLAFFPVSPMSMGSWILVVWTVVAILMIILWILKILKPLGTLLAWIGFVFAILMMTYTGVVLAASSQALWSTSFLLPALFVASAVATGVAALTIVMRLTKKRESEPSISQFRLLLTILLIVQLIVLVGFLVWLAVAGEMGALLSGSIAIAFWAGAIALGLIVPLVVEILALRKKSEVTAAVLLISPVLVVLGGFVLRAVVVIAGQV
jgi:formate-dependent nitrite reductase membrane component NrfD